ncbi:hypothetical protein BESB_045090 [Besnoitia besnoiti]|uniref:Iron-sulfur cluster assembly accessory protein n=1 Tax=Besnoitia besnoiti TaxID=94643 RepID=A0A2A9ML08_BESBE|nr:hypothetical protein BESB_045090 [Besnoitia besnoiti]PFH36317.1 hypothetical protein BESB_045090 [Besnoitia besnoiti]
MRARGSTQSEFLVLKEEDGETILHISPAAVKRLTQIWVKRREVELLAYAAASQVGKAAAQVDAHLHGTPTSLGVSASGDGAGKQDSEFLLREGRVREELFGVLPGERAQQAADRQRIRDTGGGSGHAFSTEAAEGLERKNAARSGIHDTKLGLLVRVVSGGCSGYQYCFDLVGQKALGEFRQAGTHLFFWLSSTPEGSTAGGGKNLPGTVSAAASRERRWCVVVDQCSVPLLENSVVDYSDTLTASEFRIVQNEQAENVCSCGHSFAIKDDF